VVGTVDEAGLQVVADIAAAGTDTGAPDGAPAEPVTIESVTTD
jgi:peptidyl-prolyl cis-trans isomerase B (cyclophilin B)